VREHEVPELAHERYQAQLLGPGRARRRLGPDCTL